MRALHKDIARQVRGTLSRFLSIALISMLGVGSFAGLRSVSPDMKLTADTYYNDQQLLDIYAVSTMGFSEKDVDAVRDLGCSVMPSYILDALAGLRDGAEDTVVKVYTADADDAFNRPVVTQGRLAQSAGECALDTPLMERLGASVGDTVFLSSGKTDPITDSLVSDSFTVVGEVISPLYVSSDYGGSTLGTGEARGAMYLHESAFDMEVYTTLFFRADSASELMGSTQAYDDAISAALNVLKETAAVREPARYCEIMDEANEKIADAEAELRDGEIEREEKLRDAQEKIDDAWVKIADAEQELADGREEFDSEIRKAEKEIADGEQELIDAYYELVDGEREIDENQKDIENGQREIDDGWKALKSAEYALIDGEAQLSDGYQAFDEGAAQLRGAKAELDAAKAQLDAAQQQIDGMAAAGMPGVEQAQAALDMQYAQYQAGAAQYAAGAQKLSEGQSGLERGSQSLAEGREQLEDARKELSDAQKEINDGLVKLEEARIDLAEGRAEWEQGVADLAQGKRDLEKARREGEEELLEGEEKIADAKAELEDGEREYREQEADSAKKIEDAYAELDDAKAKLEDVEEPKWYFFTRDDLPHHAEYYENADKIAAIGTVFPMVFFAVAVLISLTTISRMVDEQRGVIGTMKMLGYDRGAIAAKYVIYALLSSLLGCAGGLYLGRYLFPWLVAGAYNIQYNYPPVMMPFQWEPSLLAISVSMALIVGTAYFAARRELAETPAQLLRPRAPKPGKRILLEAIGPVWRRLPFTWKVTARNLFRYKARFIMTIAGIAGCMALLLTGFGLKDSLDAVPVLQFDRVWQYDLLVAVDPDELEGGSEGLNTLLTEEGAADIAWWHQESVDARAAEGGRKLEINLVVPQDGDALQRMISMQTYPKGEPLALGNGAVVTYKIAKLLDVGIGDELLLTDSDNAQYSVRIDGICENYIHHYVFLKEDTFREISGGAEMNVAAVKMEDNFYATKEQTATRLTQTDGIITHTFTIDTRESVGDMFGQLNVIVYVLIASAGALALAVLFNLNNINIEERVRELATIKVLGFTAREIVSYVLRESSILTIIGILFGNLAGILLHRFVMSTAEIDMVMFGREIALASFLYSIAFTLAFAALVSIAMLPKLNRIDMVESLKSAE